MRAYRRQWLRADALAGMTVWAVLVPEALAYASIAGVSPVVGLYAAPPALILYALLGSSRELIVGPMSATAALSAAAVADMATQGEPAFVTLTATLAIVAGIVTLAAGLLRLGFLANFISEPVLKGFIVGLALTIIAGQLPKLFGIEGGHGDFFERMWDLISGLGETSAATLAIGAGSLALVLGLRRTAPGVPGSLLAVALGIAIVKVADPDGVAIVGHIESGLPPLGLPGAAASDYLGLGWGAVGIALVGFAEGLGAAKTYAEERNYDVDPDRELAAVGVANLGAGLAGGMVVNGSLSKTAVNAGAGARSQLSSVVVAALTIVTLLLLTGLFEQLPEATLAAVVIAAVIELVDLGSLARLHMVWTTRLGRIYGHAARADFYAAFAAMGGVLVFDILPGLFIGIAVSLLLLLYRASRPNVVELGRLPGGHWTDAGRGGALPEPWLVVLRVEAGIFFANAEHVRQAILAHARRDGVRVLVVDAETVPYIDVTAAHMLLRLRDELERNGVELLVARDVGQVRDVLRSEGDEQRVFPSVEAAVSSGRRSAGLVAAEAAHPERDHDHEDPAGQQ
jgi:high affinity sulfate transporter 1